MTLWHFTCSHSAEQIGKRGLIQPHPHPLLDWTPLAWFTNDGSPERDEVGLTMSLVACDRMERRYRVTDASSCLRWFEWAEAHDVAPSIRVALESGLNAGSWWVADSPVPVVAA